MPKTDQKLLLRDAKSIHNLDFLHVANCMRTLVHIPMAFLITDHLEQHSCIVTQIRDLIISKNINGVVGVHSTTICYYLHQQLHVK